MASEVKPVPEGYHTATPYLTVKGAAKAIEFYKSAFGATEFLRMEAPGGQIGHAEIRIGDSPIMLSDEFPEMGGRSPETLGGTSVMIHLYVDDVDAMSSKAIAAGAIVLAPVADQFYGDRGGKLGDPFGHVWWLASHKEDLAPDEIRKRAQAMFEPGKK